MTCAWSAQAAGADADEGRRKIRDLKAKTVQLDRMLDSSAGAVVGSQIPTTLEMEFAAGLLRSSLEERQEQTYAAESQCTLSSTDDVQPLQPSRTRPWALFQVEDPDTENLHEKLAQLVGEMQELLESLPSPHARPLSADLASAESPMVAAIREEVCCTRATNLKPNLKPNPKP